MPKLSELTKNQHLKLLVYGNSGTGKTCFALGAPTPMWVADFDGKADSAGSFYKGDTERLNAIEVTSYMADPKSNPFQSFIKDINQLDPEKYQTIVIDSITTFSAALMKAVMYSNPGSNRSKMGETQVPHLKDYQIAISHFKDIVVKLLSMPLNVIMTAHIQTNKDETTGAITYDPLIWGKDLPDWLPMVFKEVYQTFTETRGKETLYFAQTKNRNKVRARSQIPGLPDPLKLDFKELKKYL